MRKIAGYLTKNRSGKDPKIAQSTHEKGYIKPRKTFWRNSKQLLNEPCPSPHAGYAEATVTVCLFGPYTSIDIKGKTAKDTGFRTFSSCCKNKKDNRRVISIEPIKNQ